MEIVFYGVRGTRTVIGPAFERYGGRTACVGVHVRGPNGATLMFDGGTGISAAGAELMGSRAPVTIFLSHLHHDHLTGLPLFAPLFETGRRVQLFVPVGMKADLLAYFAPPYYPLTIDDLPADVMVTELPDDASVVCRRDGRAEIVGAEIDGSVLSAGVDRGDEFDKSDLAAGDIDGHRRAGEASAREDEPVVHSLRLPPAVHPRNGVTVYAVRAKNKRVVYASDVEWLRASEEDQQRFVEFARGADVLILDAQYREEEYEAFAGRGHNTVLTATEVGRRAEVDQLILFHHDPHRDDAAIDELERIARESEAARGLGRVRAAREGLHLTI